VGPPDLPSARARLTIHHLSSRDYPRLNDGLRTFNRDCAPILCRLRVNSHHFTFADKLNGAPNLPMLYAHNETHRSVLRNYGGGFHQEAADANVSAHGFDLNRAISGVWVQANRILQVKTAMFALLRRQ
jgi:hypothetical protein